MMRRYFATVTFGLGIFLLLFSGYLVWERLAPPAVAVGPASPLSPLPTVLEIPALALHLPIFPSRPLGNQWETVKDGVSYSLDSPLPGERGNSVMYGHNWPNLLGSLKSVKPGDEIIIHFGSEKSLRYLIHYVTVVAPTQTQLNTSAPDSRLTLYTCTGFLDTQRLVVTALLQD